MNRVYSGPVSGANTIGILDLNGNDYKLSKIGRFCLEHFLIIGLDPISKLQEILDKTKEN